MFFSFVDVAAAAAAAAVAVVVVVAAAAVGRKYWCISHVTGW